MSLQPALTHSLSRHIKMSVQQLIFVGFPGIWRFAQILSKHAKPAVLEWQIEAIMDLSTELSTPSVNCSQALIIGSLITQRQQLFLLPTSFENIVRPR
jgi:hypothetical protein